MKDIDIGDLLYSHKTVTGFFLPNWLHKKGMISLISLMRRLKNFMHRELSSEISERISIEEFEAGVDSYQKNMSKGKVVILPNN